MTREQILARLAYLDQLLQLVEAFQATLETIQPDSPLIQPNYRATEQTGNIHEIRDYSRPADAPRAGRRND